MLLSLVACSNNASTGNDDAQQADQTATSDNESNESENITEESSESEENTDNESKEAAVPSFKEFKSDDNQCVIIMEGAYVVYGLDGDNIISCTSYIEYGNVDIAKAAYEDGIEEINKDPDIIDCRLEGNVIISEYSEGSWEGLNKTMLETVFADKLVK